MTWVTNWLASRLSAEERDAVLGDAAERRTPVVRDLLSVLLWREARAWTTAAPWLALLTLVLPLGFVLSVVARAWAAGFAPMFWIYVNNWTWEYVTNPGARLDLLMDFVGPTILKVVCLVLWSWTVGRALRVLSRRAVDSNAIMLTGVVLVGTVGTTTLGMLNPANALVFSSGVYRLGIPLIVRITLVLMPIWCGAVRQENTRWWATVGRAAVTAVLIGVTFGQVAGALWLGWIPATMIQPHFGATAFWWAARFQGWARVLPLLFPLALAWPAAYLLIQAHRNRLAT
jgi:hypothetical protein